MQRVLMRHGVSRDLAKILVEDIKNYIDFFGGHPITTPLNETESTAYHH